MKLTTEDVVAMYQVFRFDVNFLKFESINTLALPFRDIRFKGERWFGNEYQFDLKRELFKELNLEALRVPGGDNEDSIQDTDLEKVDTIDISSPQFLKAVEKLNACLNEENLAAIAKIREEYSCEDGIVAGVATHLISKLSGDAFTSQSKIDKFKEAKAKCACGCKAEQKLKPANMCIGSEKTWHGELDLLSGTAVSVLVTKSLDEDTDDEAIADEGYPIDAAEDGAGSGGDKFEQDSLGDNANVEIKQTLTAQSDDILRLYSQAVVFAWVEYNRHRNYSPFIPSIMISNNRFILVVYNPVSDSFLTSDGAVDFISEGADGPFQYIGIFILWLILNHRLFFRVHMREVEEMPCGFKNLMPVEEYKQLTSYYKMVRRSERYVPSYVIPMRGLVDLSLWKKSKRKKLF